MEVILSILTALFGIGFGIFMALHPEDAIALHDRGRYTQTEPTEAYIKLTRLEGIGLSVLCAVLLVVLLFGQLVARLVPPDQLMAGEQAQQDAW